ncbi:SdpI family protein [Leucobacter aridicollis]|uniref:SdpI family protein n=1 Tax=Leucobacter aridicollis TaxID=283878 RepID=UPI0021FD3180|nr:SdpI family protein [Leucobacter aridicollis]
MTFGSFNWFFLAVTGVVISVILLGATGRIRRNRYVGVRTRHTLKSDEGWIAGHRAIVGPTLILLLPTAIILIGSAATSSKVRSALVALSAALIIATALIGSVTAERAAKRLSTKRRPAEENNDK